MFYQFFLEVTSLGPTINLNTKNNLTSWFFEGTSMEGAEVVFMKLYHALVYLVVD